jgi:hypothetical protein
MDLDEILAVTVGLASIVGFGTVAFQNMKAQYQNGLGIPTRRQFVQEQLKGGESLQIIFGMPQEDPMQGGVRNTLVCVGRGSYSLREVKINDRFLGIQIYKPVELKPYNSY